MSETYTAFEGQRRLAQGSLADIALAVQHAEKAPAAPILVFADATGKAIDLDTRGSAAEVAARYAPAPASGPEAAELRGRGRPKLGVVPREVTLLPRHWDWLAEQQGGASVALRRLIDEARRREDGWAEAKRARRLAQDAAYHFMSAMAGDLPGFEEAIRALYADDRKSVAARVANWPGDIRDHALRLAYGDAPLP